MTDRNFTIDGDWNGLYLDGEWVEAGDGETITVENPATREAVAEVPAATEDDVDRAYETAAEAQDSWSQRSVDERASVIEDAIEILDDRRDDILEALAVESGSANAKAFAEWQTAQGMCHHAKSLAGRTDEVETSDSMIPGKENEVQRVPEGVVGVISPWNFPLNLSMRAVAPALATGNAVVLKPASSTPVTGGLLIARIFEEAGLPDGVLNVVTGHGSEIGDRVAGHPELDVMAFTGSTEVGRGVAAQAAENLAIPAMELGGNNPFVVTEDADVDAAVDSAVFGSFLHQGQICISINRHLVHESLYDEYVEQLAERAESLPIGDPRERENVVGPVIDEGQRDQILEYVEETVEQGATLETGGDHDDLFVEPTVLSDATNDMAAACNEHFGPVAPVIPFSSEEEAIELANDTEHGLAAAIHGGDLDRAKEIAEQIEAGMVHINDQPVNEEPNVPFGGMKASGIGRYDGEEILHELTQTKWISTQTEKRDYPF
ncbi:aldehyde dehydrogenase family protein [Halorussus gelatinilyticus]|uniref:Aldehyde dehydrogenase family protein n=1 Tax=Halorussus gelatinilyticus TaxID=2937524 RepID=A0A8U0ILL6_9EURY|nr:aldehyde dehydrogenase family protein [Halorussus gelatinilyticus]UPW02020.1 aldehyde dehydrogenase family protein [Halorussus gelatinilyticus]